MKIRNVIAFSLIIGALLFWCSHAWAVTYDAYHGINEVSCSNGPEAHFYTQKIGNRWWICDPLGHGYFIRGAILVEYNQNANQQTNIISKYNGTANANWSEASTYWFPNWALVTTSRLASWGFNDLSDGSSSLLWATSVDGRWTTSDHTSAYKMPFNIGAHLTIYALNNTQGCGASSPIKDLMVGVGAAFTGTTYNTPDWYDPSFSSCATNVLNSTNNPNGLYAALGTAAGSTTAHADYFVYATLDEGDETGFLGDGPDFAPLGNDGNPLSSTSFTSPHSAWIVLSSSPSITGGSVRNVGSVTYSNQENLTKVKFANELAAEYLCTAAGAPLAGCTGNKTGNVSVDPNAGAGVAVTGANMTTATNALNAAWGSSFTTLSTSDTHCTSNLAVCLGSTGSPTYVSWAGANCKASGQPIANCTGAGTGTGTAGTGLLDEDGSDQFMGDACNQQRSADPQSCLSGRTTAETTAMRSDLDNLLLKNYIDQYFTTVVGILNTDAPGILLQMQIGGFGTPARAVTLQESCKYLTLPQMTAPMVVPADEQARYDFTANNCGNHPWMYWRGSFANPDSSESANIRTDNVSSTQAGRGTAYASVANNLAFAKGTSDNTYHTVGWYWWEYEDSDGEGLNWGLTTRNLDNPYDGTSAIIAPGTNSYGFATGGEAGNYGNFIGPVTTANLGIDTALAVTTPRANPGPFTFIETWDEYGVQGSVPAIAPYVTIDPATQSILCGQTVPWNHPGQHLTGCYLRIVPSGHGGENPGPTVATRAGQLGNPSQSLITYTWFRAEVAPASNAAIFLWCDSTNPNQPPRGVDQSYIQLSHNGQLKLFSSSNTQLGNSGAFHLTFGTALTNWYLLESIITIGVNSAAAWQQGSVTLNIYQSNGSRVDSFGCTNCATNANNASLLIDQIAFDAEFDNSIVEDFGPSWVINPGTNGTTAFVGPQYSWFTTPSGDSTPLQYLVTGAATHHAAVSNVPSNATKYVSTAIQGNQDEYTANFPNDFDSITEQALVSFQESDAGGVRLGTDLSVSPGAITTTGNQCALTNGTYTFCESFYANPSMPTKIGLELGW